MMGLDQQQFIIRHNLDDSYDSICLRCFRTVGTASRQSELAAFERNHVCEDRSNHPFPSQKSGHVPPPIPSTRKAARSIDLLSAQWRAHG